MSIKYRGEFADANDQISLSIVFKNQYGVPTNTDTVPTFSIISPTNLVIINPPTSAGVSQTGVGQYNYIYSVPYNPTWGVYTDVWTGFVNGERIEASFNFIVAPTQYQSPNQDGYVSLGDDPGFHFNQIEIANINKVLKLLKARLNSSGKVKSKDGYGNVIYVNCDIFSVETLVDFVVSALSYFNMIPHFTEFTFADATYPGIFIQALVDIATLYALTSHALIERGSEYTLSDNGLSFSPPTVSDIMMTQYSTALTVTTQNIKDIKASMKPGPISLGIVSISSGNNPSIRRLRHLRERRLI